MTYPGTLLARVRSIASLGLLVLATAGFPSLAAAQAQVCDVDANGAVDILDIHLILGALGQPATGPDDPRDSVPDGTITINDARACVYRCTLPGCVQNRPPTAQAGADQTVFVGELVTLDGSGSSDPDGDALTFSWNLTVPSGSAASLSDAGAVMPTFFVDVPGTYVAELVVNDGVQSSAPDTVSITTENSPPVANAGPDQTVFVGELVTLDGSASFDVDGDSLTYAWSFSSTPSGSAATLSGASTVSPTFTPDLFGVYVVELVVNDGMVSSAADLVLVTTENSAPVANAGPDQFVFVGDTAMLDGSGSSDVDGDPLTYAWSFVSKPLGSLATLTGSTTVTPSFDVDVFGVYVVQLIVNDGALDSDPNNVVITTENSAPVANAGPDQTVFVGDTVFLDGSASSDVDGDGLTFQWALTTVPPGSAAVLSDPTEVFPSFDVDLPGTYVAQLIVNDGSVDSAPDTVMITTENSAPVADAGPDQTVFVTDTVTLDGSASSDADGDVLTFAWSFSSRPSGSTAAFDDPTSVSPSFVADLPGTYIAQLIVNDGSLDSAPDSVMITTENSAPVADAGPDQTVMVTDTVTLDGSGSSDVDGDTLTYAWMFVSTPSGSSATPTGETTVSPTFVVDVPGTYEVQLVVNDGLVDSTPDTVLITTENSAPVADAGPDQTVFVTDTVTLDGSGSSDVDGDTLTYAWMFVSTPSGSSATLTGETTVSPTFVVDVPGTYEVQLVVNDGLVDSAPDTVVVTASVPLSLSLAPEVLELLTFESGDFTVTSSAPAGPGGILVDVVSSDPSVVVAPAPVLIPEGATQNVFSVTAGAASGTATVSVSSPGITGDSSTVNVTARDLALTTESTLVGVGRTISGEVSITPAAPPGGVTVTLGSDDEGIATISPVMLTIPEGETTAAVTVDGIAVGTTTLRANASGYAESTVSMTTTDFLISINTGLTLAPGQTSSLAVSLTKMAPPGGTTINFVMADPTVATITPSVFVPEGAFLPTANPQVTGVAIGSTTVTATASGFAPDTRPVNVTLSMSFSPASLTIPPGSSSIQLNLSAPAPLGGLVVGLSSDDPSIVSVPASVAISQGQTSAQVSIQGLTQGSTIIRANASGIAEATASVTVGGSIVINDISIGKNLQFGYNGGFLGAPAPAGGVAVTITSLDPASVLVSTGATVPGSASIVRNVPAGSATIPEFFVQGLTDTGTATLEISAPGFVTDTSTITLTPSGFRFIGSTSNINTTTFSANVGLQIASVRLVPGTLDFIAVQAVRAGLTVNVDVTSSDPSVGVVTPSPLVFTGGQATGNPEFDPLAAGVTTLTVVAPSGFATPNGGTARTATVTAPDIRFNGSPGGDVSVGDSLQRSVNVTLEAAPPSPVDVTINLGSAATATISDNPSVNGTTSISFLGVTTTSVGTIYLQGQNQGTTSFTATATGYNTNNSTATVTPSGFRFTGNTPVFTTTSFSPNRPMAVSAVQLNASLGLIAIQALRPGVSVSVAVTSSDPAVGVFTVSPLTFLAGDLTKPTEFDPIGPGTSNLTVVTPAGFETPNAGATGVATVTAPSTLVGGSTGGATFQVGENLQRAIPINLEAPPPAPVNVTISVASPGVATLSLDPLVEGSASVTFTGVTSTFAGNVYVQGRSQASTALTASATGYTTTNHTVTVVPSGFRFGGLITPSFETTTFSNNTAMTVLPVALDPATLGFLSVQSVRGGLSVDVTLTSSQPAVGTIASPVHFDPGASTMPTSFDPLTAGTTVLNVVQPPGFSTPNLWASVTASVRAPNAFLSGGSVGLDLQTQVFVVLEAAPPQPVDVTVTVSSGSIATISANAALEGGTSITFTGVTSTNAGVFFLQGRSLGSTSVTVQAAGYDDGTLPVDVTPSGFRLVGATQSDFTTTAGAANRLIQVAAARLDPTTLAYVTLQNVRGGLSVNVAVTSSDPTVGVITSSPLVFTSSLQILSTEFDPIAPGNTAVTVEVPAGFSLPSAFTSVTAFVNP